MSIEFQAFESPSFSSFSLILAKKLAECLFVKTHEQRLAAPNGGGAKITSRP